MNHLNEDTLNAYLDAALDIAARTEAEAHLAACPECAARLESMRSVFAALEALPEAGLTRDLSVGVVNAIKPSRAPLARPALTPAIRIAFVFQGLFAVLALAAAIPFGLQFFTNLPAFEFPVIIEQSLIANLQSLLTIPTPEIILPDDLFALLVQLPNAEFSTLAITICLAAVTLLWFIANGLLLHPARVARK